MIMIIIMMIIIIMFVFFFFFWFVCVSVSGVEWTSSTICWLVAVTFDSILYQVSLSLSLSLVFFFQSMVSRGSFLVKWFLFGWLNWKFLVEGTRFLDNAISVDGA